MGGGVLKQIGGSLIRWTGIGCWEEFWRPGDYAGSYRRLEVMVVCVILIELRVSLEECLWFAWQDA